MKFRLWPKSLVGQLVFAIAVMLFVAQAINFALLVRGQKELKALQVGGDRSPTSVPSARRN